MNDILQVWMDSLPYKAGASKLLIVADSCHSGAMAAQLRALCTRRGMPSREVIAARSVAIQTACASNEVAFDGVFTKAYVDYAGENQKIIPRRLFEDAEFPGLCNTCSKYRNPKCRGCKEVEAHYLYMYGKAPPGQPEEMPKPEFYCPWGAKELSTGEKPFLLYKSSW